MAVPADQVKLRKRLEVLLKQPDNQVCADCNKRGPRWASANLGIFFCIECSGIHRNLGVHISFVRSVNLDSWTNKQVEFMEEWGNGRANAYYEANLPPHVHKPKEGDSVRTIEKYIRDKYEHKRFIASSMPERGATPAVATAAPVAAEAPRANTASANGGRGFVYDDEPAKSFPAAVPRQSAAQVRSTPVAAPATVAVVAPAAPVVDLLNFMDEPCAPSPVNVSPFAPTNGASSVFGFDAPAAAPQNGNHGVENHFAGDFSSFQSAPAAAAPQQAQQQQAQFSNGFGFDFGPADSLTAPAPVQQQQQQQAPAKPQASADSILSLFASPVPQHQQGGYGQPAGYPPQMMMQQGGGMHQMQMQQGGGGGFYPPQQQQQQQQHHTHAAALYHPHAQTQQQAQQQQYTQQHSQHFHASAMYNPHAPQQQQQHQGFPGQQPGFPAQGFPPQQQQQQQQQFNNFHTQNGGWP